MKKNKNGLFFSPWLAAPLLMMALLVIVVLIYAGGRDATAKAGKISLMPDGLVSAKFSGEDSESGYVIAYDGKNEKSAYLSENTGLVLDNMRLKYRYLDLAEERFSAGTTELLLLCTGNLSLLGDAFEDFVYWLDRGNMIWCCMPEFSPEFTVISHLIGITAANGTYTDSVNDIIFTDDIVPGLENLDLTGLKLGDTAMNVSLESTCNVSIRDTASGVPLLWELETKDRHVSVMNNNLLYERNTINGIITHLIARHRDFTVWPVMNALLVYIDDFPAPQPEGYDERLKKQFGYDTQGFYMNVWWPDMKSIAQKFGIRYTGVFVETYNDNMTPPLERGVAGTLLRYYGADLISTGGEIALHGYNHQPLIPEGYPNEDDYKGWPSEENMTAATKELVKYAEGIFPELKFTSYVPPSNLLSEEGSAVLRKTLPELRVLSGLYYVYQGNTSYRTDFEALPDGTINVPRITAGYSMEAYEKLRLYNSLFDIGVFSHFIHPDDVLDDERGAALGWTAMKEDFTASMENITELYPMLRGMTATTAGAAVQRNQTAQPVVTVSDTEADIVIEGFFDRCWIALCTDREIASVDGGTLYGISGDYYWIDCENENVTVYFGGQR